jgi:predicted transposase/invertase (TIGR01784 family)
MEEKIRRDNNMYLSAAKAEGREEGKLDAARKMLDDNIPLEKVSKYTGLPIEELEKLKD